jgi:hypothetical protein
MQGKTEDRKPRAMEYNVGASQEQRRSRDDGAIRASDVDAGQIKKEEERKGRGRSAARRHAVLLPLLLSLSLNLTRENTRQNKTRQDKMGP